MKLGVWIVREEAKAVGTAIADGLNGTLFTPDQFTAGSNQDNFRDTFNQYTYWVLVMTTGIAYRYITGLTASKLSDPGVVVIDEACLHSISFISGHEGGANELAYKVASITGANPVITTATEANKDIIIGIGCRRDIPCVVIDSIIQEGLIKVNKQVSDIKHLATIDVKKDEIGILEWCDKNNVPLQVIPQAIIKSRPWTYSPSEWVEKNINVAGVSEPCALLSSHRSDLILQKFSRDGVSIAIAQQKVIEL